MASVLTVVAAIAVIGLVVDDDPRSSSEAALSGSGQNQSGAGGSNDVVRAALAQCRDVWAQQSRPIRTAARSLAQWRVHIDAMNSLVAGEITLEQATEFWDSTRVGAKARVARFEKAVAAYTGSVGPCLQSAEVAAQEGPRPQVSKCVRSISARDQAVDSARTAIATWKHHIHDMEMLRAGQLSPEEATQMWLQNWRTGIEQLDDHAADIRRARRTGSC